MRTTLTAQQMSFFTRNGYIELSGIAFDPKELFLDIQQTLAQKLKIHTSKLPSHSAETQYLFGRDLWRWEKSLHSLWMKKLSPIALALTGKNQLRFGLDQWIPSGHSLGKPAPAKDLFCIQGLTLGVLFTSQAPPAHLHSSLGVFPLPKDPHNVLFFRMNLILDWPQLLQTLSTDLYLGAYAVPNALYIQNPLDPSTNSLKALGYGFGDLLTNESHPLIIQP